MSLTAMRIDCYSDDLVPKNTVESRSVRRFACLHTPAKAAEARSRDMISRRVLVLVALITTALSSFLLGSFQAHIGDDVERATYDAKLDAIRAEVRTELRKTHGQEAVPAGTSGLSGTAASGPINARA